MMKQYTWIEVIDAEGWRKIFPLDKGILHIGSDFRNDIRLARRQGGPPWRIQLIVLSSDPPSYRLVNLERTNVTVGVPGETLAPHRFTDITNGESIGVEDFTLVLRHGQAAPNVSDVHAMDEDFLPQPSGVVANSPHIGLELFLPQRRLGPDHIIDGFVTVRNLGNEPSVQFKLTVMGLLADCYKIGAGPLLFPDAERQVFFHIFHPRRPTPLAGECRFSVHATADEAYPGERATVREIIHILPFYAHELNWETGE